MAVVVGAGLATCCCQPSEASCWSRSLAKPSVWGVVEGVVALVVVEVVLVVVLVAAVETEAEAASWRPIGSHHSLSLVVRYQSGGGIHHQVVGRGGISGQLVGFAQAQA